VHAYSTGGAFRLPLKSLFRSAWAMQNCLPWPAKNHNEIPGVVLDETATGLQKASDHASLGPCRAYLSVALHLDAFTVVQFGSLFRGQPVGRQLTTLTVCSLLVRQAPSCSFPKNQIFAAVFPHLSASAFGGDQLSQSFCSLRRGENAL